MPKKKMSTKCPDCGTGEMAKQTNGTHKCSACGAVLIPSSLTGIFIPGSFIGIH